MYVNWAYLSNNPLIYRTIFGPEGFSAYVWENTGSISEWMSQFFSSTIGYYVSLSVLAVLVGIAVYTLLQIVSFAVTGTVHYFQRAELATSPTRLMEIFMQLWIRSLALVGIVFFSAAVVGTIIPTIEALIDTGANLLNAFQLIGLIQYSIGFLLTAVSLHMFVVFVRILVLRPRLFSSTLTD
ncbi:MAG: hypothetical protein ABIR46_01245 [Candidatus Saccharimonadales bacterium]